MKTLNSIENNCKITVTKLSENKLADFNIDILKMPFQAAWIGKKVGDVLKTASGKDIRVEKIMKPELAIKEDVPTKIKTIRPKPDSALRMDYMQVEKRFNINIKGFSRGINIKNNSIVLISVIDKNADYFKYHDGWLSNGDYCYSGEGKHGDQKLERGNLALANASRDGKDVHLLLRFSSGEYYYQGVFAVIDYVVEEDPDEEGILRKEFKFILRKDDFGCL